MARNQLKSKGRSVNERFLALPFNVWSHPDFKKMSPRATKLSIDFYGQYNGYNNGDLQMTMSFMRQRGWNSNSQLYKARDELIDRGLLVQTRQGGRNHCSLYAITWRRIDECGGKLEINATDANYRTFIHGVPFKSAA